MRTQIKAPLQPRIDNMPFLRVQKGTYTTMIITDASRNHVSYECKPMDKNPDS
jgi:hypothetical protein